MKIPWLDMISFTHTLFIMAYNHYHNQVMLPAWISLILSLHLYLLSIAPNRLLPTVYFLCLHRPNVGKFLLVGQHWPVHV